VSAAFTSLRMFTLSEDARMKLQAPE